MDETQGFFVNTPMGEQIPTQSSPELELGYNIREAKKAGFSDAEIVSELGKQIPNVSEALKAGFTPSQIVEEYMLRSMGVSEVAKRAVTNLPSSLGGVVKSLAEAVASPLETAKTVLDVGAGVLQNILPEKMVQVIGEDKASRDLANRVGQFYVDRYGSIENVKKAVATDPAGVMADLSTLISGGAGATRTAADVATIASKGAITAPRAIAPVLSQAASAVDPLALAARGIGATVSGVGKNVVAPIMGMQTGAGREAIAQAFEAGRKGGTTAEQFRANITGRADPTQVLDIARSNLDEMNRLKQAEYRSGMLNISKDKSVLDFAEIEKGLKDATAKTTYQGKVVNVRAAESLDEVAKVIDEWKKADPANFHTPEGLDALKKRVGDLLESVPFEQKTARSAVGEVYNSIKSTIQKQAPTYSNTMKAYAEASDQIREIERALSLGKKASVDTAMRKLQSLMRNNVQTNYGTRAKLAKQLESVGGEFMPGLAGQALRPITPRGLQQVTGGGLGAYFALTGNIPQALGVAALSSPRIMGETAYATGAGARMAGQAAKAAPLIVNPQLYNLLYQSGNIQGLLE